jgi:hypothetical protein
MRRGARCRRTRFRIAGRCARCNRWHSLLRDGREGQERGRADHRRRGIAAQLTHQYERRGPGRGRERPLVRGGYVAEEMQRPPEERHHDGQPHHGQHPMVHRGHRATSLGRHEPPPGRSPTSRSVGRAISPRIASAPAAGADPGASYRPRATLQQGRGSRSRPPVVPTRADQRTAPALDARWCMCQGGRGMHQASGHRPVGLLTGRTNPATAHGRGSRRWGGNASATTTSVPTGSWPARSPSVRSSSGVTSRVTASSLATLNPCS